MTKKTIQIKGKFIGDNHAYLKHGDPLTITFNKQEILHGHMYRNIRMSAHTDERISLIEYVRKRVNYICETGDIFLINI